MFTHPRYKSVTRWGAHGLNTPTSYATFSSMIPDIKKLCPCIFKSGHLFQWKLESTFLPDAPVLSSNDSILESAMWLLQDLLGSLRLMEESKGETIYGQILQTAYKQLHAINTLDWPQRDADMVRLILNWDKPWSKLTNGMYKIPWYLLPKCNEPLRLFLHAEMMVYAQKLRLEKRSLSMAEGARYNAMASQMLQQAVDCSTSCPPVYKAALIVLQQQREVDACVWLAKLEDYSDPEKLRMIEHAVNLAKSIKSFSTAKLSKLETDLEKLKRGSLFVGGSHYSDGLSVVAILAKHNWTDEPMAQIDDLLAHNYV